MTDPRPGSAAGAPAATIRRLPEALVREIAAGEVVQGPADALKELLENALDAGATRLEVALEGGGATRLAVRDNGCGIPEAELPLAVEPHCTSKLEALSRIATLGFRGEGLHALRNAGRLRITSRPAAQLGGATLEADGERVHLTRHPAPAGTLAELSELFERLPARRRALQPAGVETKACLALLGRYLLHHPQLRVRVTVDGEARWSYAGGGFAAAAGFWWGPVTANRLLPLAGSWPGGAATGLVSRPELGRPRGDRLWLAVNGRPVQWPPALLSALLAAYRELLPSGHHPVGVVNLELPFDAVLVNAAPDKGRVQLLDPEAASAGLGRAVAEALAAHPLARALPDFRGGAPGSVGGDAPGGGSGGVGAAPRSAFPRLRFAGRYRELYLLAESGAAPGGASGGGDLWVVDQHAAHERILFEELSARFAAEPPVELAHPELLTLSAEEAERYRAAAPELAARGLTLEPFGGERWRVRSVPAFLAGHPELVAEVVRSALAAEALEPAWRAVLGRLACLPAIKAGHPLAGAEAQRLLDALGRCETPWVCPHGRPTALVLSELELARRFGRRGERATLGRAAALDER